MRRFLSIATVVVLSLPAFAARPESTNLESSAKQIVGAWQLDFTTPDGVKRTPVILVGRQHQELVAWYVDKEKSEAFQNVKLDDDSLVLTIRPEEHKNVEVTFKASLERDDVCVGEATYCADDGDTGNWDFKGRRMTAADVTEVQEWQLRFVAPDDQQHEAIVTVVERNDEWYAWYTSKDLDLPAQRLSVDGGKVVMSVKTKTPDGQDIEVCFRGTIEEDLVKGDAEYDLEGDTGSFPFSGKRKS